MIYIILFTMIVTSSIYTEKRKGKVKNVPLQLYIFFDKKIVSVFNTGYRCDINQWDADNQIMKKNQVNNPSERLKCKVHS